MIYFLFKITGYLQNSHFWHLTQPRKVLFFTFSPFLLRLHIFSRQKGVYFCYWYRIILHYDSYVYSLLKNVKNEIRTVPFWEKMRENVIGHFTTYYIVDKNCDFLLVVGCTTSRLDIWEGRGCCQYWWREWCLQSE